ncbi:Regulatory protein Spx [Anoxybacillus sp. BCO1]|nr:Regulatory protein Spx [Anoxybacillus sp. BCO1]
MVIVYSSPSCTSCRKAKAWLEEHNIPYKERNIFAEPLTIEEIKGILRMTENGTDEIISTRSKIFQKLNIQVDSLPLQDLYEIIRQHPGFCAVRLSWTRSACKLVTTKMKFAAFYREKCGRINCVRHNSSSTVKA